MKIKSLVLFGISVVSTLGCQPKSSDVADLPANYGFYAIDGGRTILIDAFPEKRPDFNAKVEFLFFDKNVGFKNMDLKLFKIVFKEAPDGSVSSEHEEIAVKSSSSPVKGQPEMVRIIPAHPLEPGLYFFKGVGGNPETWPNLTQRLFLIDPHLVSKAVDEGTARMVQYNREMWLKTNAKNTCIGNLKRLESAIQEWALDNRKLPTDAPTYGDVLPYLKKAAVQELECPAGGHYNVGTVGQRPTCNIPEHVLP